MTDHATAAGISEVGTVFVPVSDVSVGDPVPPQFFVRDPDGNRFLIVQPG